MRVEILDCAHEDMANGYAFYEHQAAGLGAYFSDTLYSEMESLQLYAGIHPAARRLRVTFGVMVGR